MTHRLRRPALLLLAAGLAACSGSEREAEAPENTAEIVREVPAPVEAPAPVDTPAPAETTESNVEAPADEEPSPDEQMLDDASATGMTSRAARGEEATDAEVQAAENGETL